MNKDQVKGMSNQATGSVKKEVGKLTGYSGTQLRGQARETKGKLQKGKGDVKETMRRDDVESTRRR